MRVMNFDRIPSGRRGPSLLSGLTVVGLALAGWLALAASACDLSVNLPGEVEDTDLAGIESLPLLATSVHGVFECAFSQYAFLSGFLGDEMYHSGSRAALIAYDRRAVFPENGNFGGGTCPGGQFGSLYTPMAQARWMADDILRRAEKATEQELPGVTKIRALAANLAGYQFVFFGEGYCSAAFDAGPELFPPQIFKLAVERFTKAIEAAEAAKARDQRNLAYVGRARARLNLRELAAAASDARQVDEGFTFNATRSTVAEDRWNPFYYNNHELQELQAHPNFWNLQWQGVPDPRPKVVVTGKPSRMGQDVPEALMNKYTSRSSPIRLASHVEALLIIAEAEGGQTAVGIINTLHKRAGLPPFASADPTEIKKMVHEQRKRELYLEGHRLNDMRRLGLPFESGGHVFIKGRFYGDTECFPLPDIERLNNPNLRPGS